MPIALRAWVVTYTCKIKKVFTTKIFSCKEM